jgi:predicted O-linked N-acetylglucosamine transferase (SPINDLY family)
VLEQLIRRDQIDILVDLAGHSGSNRLPVFARKAAPVQVSYLGYPDTTGLATMDYRLTDAIADPPGVTDQFNREKLIRLPQSAWCYEPPDVCPPIAPLPMLMSEHVTFASFNHLAKLTPKMLELWARVLREVPRSCLLMKAISLSHDGARQRIAAKFRDAGIETERIELVGRTPGVADHLRMYGRCDIALDTFPYNGTTTTCEALWMGLPVVTLCGTNQHMARVSASLLTTAELGDFVAHSPDQFVAIAVRAANDPSRLAEIRSTMRPRLEASPLRQASAFTRNLESVFRKVWREFCSSYRRT